MILQVGSVPRPASGRVYCEMEGLLPQKNRVESRGSMHRGSEAHRKDSGVYSIVYLYIYMYIYILLYECGICGISYLWYLHNIHIFNIYIYIYYSIYILYIYYIIYIIYNILYIIYIVYYIYYIYYILYIFYILYILFTYLWHDADKINMIYMCQYLTCILHVYLNTHIMCL